MHTPVECPFCHNPLEAELLEVWDRDFLFTTCCEAMQDELLLELKDGGPRSAIIRNIFSAAGIDCRQIFSDLNYGGNYQIDHGLTLAPVDLATAKDFISVHHRHHKPSLSWRFGLGVRNGPDLIGVCMVGRPVARMIDPSATVEVNRLCVRDDLPAALVWNACSMLYAAAAREARRRGFSRIITYILEAELGTSLLAAGWTREALTKGGSWHRPNRPRSDDAPIGRKWRYGKNLSQTSRGNRSVPCKERLA